MQHTVLATTAEEQALIDPTTAQQELLPTLHVFHTLHITVREAHINSIAPDCGIPQGLLHVSDDQSRSAYASWGH